MDFLCSILYEEIIIFSKTILIVWVIIICIRRPCKYPSSKRSVYPPKVAAIATVVALLELFFSIQGQATGAEFYAMFFFIGTIICFGYVLEIQFIEKGIEAYGIG